MKRLSLLFILLALATAALAFSTWDGSVSRNWNDPSNWTPYGVPTATTDVDINGSAASQYPIINATATCRDLQLEDGVTLTISLGYSLTVAGDAYLNGNLVMSSAGDLIVQGNIDWWTLGEATVSSTSAYIEAYGNMTFNVGSSVQFSSGTIRFRGSAATSTLTNHSASTQLNVLYVMKTSGNFEIPAASTQPFTVNTQIQNASNNTFTVNYAGAITVGGYGINDYNTVSSYGIKWNAGTLVVDGTNPFISLAGPGCWLNNLTCSASGNVTAEYDLILKGNMLIESGSLIRDPNCDTITVGGNWNNTVGDAGYQETGSRVIFNRTSSHPYVQSDEIFDVLEVATGTVALRFSSGADVTCNVYDWTSGGIDVNTASSFTALDLYDSAIEGGWWLTSTLGVINVSNNDAGDVHLHGSLNISAGEFNVYDTSAFANDSAWGSYGTGSLTMSGGKLDFKNVGILISVLAPYTFTENITGGTICTVGNVECFYPAFTPTGSTLEMNGGSTKYLNMSSGTLSSLNINKPAAQVYLYSATTLGGALSITAGTFYTAGYNFGCNNIYVYGNLKLDARMTVIGNCYWYSGSTTDIAAGSIMETNGSWYAYSGSNPVFSSTSNLYFYGTGARDIRVSSSAARFGNLTIGANSTGGTFTGGVYSLATTSTQNFLIPGWMDIKSGNTLNLNATDMIVTTQLTHRGTLQIDSSSALIGGNLVMSGASISINTGTLSLFNDDLYFTTGSTVSMVSGLIVCDGIYAGGVFQPAGGTVKLYSLNSTPGTVYMAAGNWVPNLEIDGVSKTYHLTADLTIKGSFKLSYGQFSVVNPISLLSHDISITQNWLNNQSPANFIEGSGRVIFNGGGFQAIQASENFNIVEVNKIPSGGGDALRVETLYPGVPAIVTCNVYDWTAGALDVFQEGSFTALDLADNGLYGDFCCNTGCVLNLTDDTGINLYGEMHVTGGEVNVFCSNGAVVNSYWPAAATAVIDISSGSLNFRDKGIWLQNGYALLVDITGGTISTTGNIIGRRDNFNPAGGTFAFVGTNSTTIDFDVTTSNFHNLLIDKDNPSDNVELISGSSIPLICNGDVVINRGTFHMNREALNCFGNLDINDGGTMSFVSFNFVRMTGNKVINVNDGGQIDVYGSTADQRTTFTHILDGNYYLNVHAGGMISAIHTVFEYLNTNGVYVRSGGMVGGLHYCTFRDGVSGSSLLRVENGQDLTLTYINFPTNAGLGATNARKAVDSGTLTFSNYSGAFSGAAYEGDPYSRIFWVGTDKDLQITSVTWNRPDDYVCAPITATITVTNNGTNDIVTPFRVDLYKNLPIAPPVGDLGDLFATINVLEGGQSKTVTFSNISTDIPGSWISWFRVDTSDTVPETNETNNIWATPIYTDWLALPEITDLEISQTGSLTVRLTWTYPISVSRYNAYRSDDPYFASGAGTPWVQTANTYVNTLAIADRWFYLVKAERDLP